MDRLFSVCPIIAWCGRDKVTKLSHALHFNWSRNSTVGIATGHGLNDSSDRSKNFLFSISSRPVLGPPQPPNSKGTEYCFRGGEAAGV
jgi:hypothetical protein